jgi:anti-sigma factor RsiW
MAGRIVKFSDGAHPRSEALLPWLVNGTLDDDERALVEQHLRDCGRCQREVNLLRELQTVYREDTSPPPTPTAFSQLNARLNEAPLQSVRLRKLWRLWRQAPTWAQGIFATQFAIIALLGGLLLAGPPLLPLYQTLGSTDAASPPRGSLVVVFNPQTSEAELQRIVRRVAARIVDGPSEAHAYVLELPAGASAKALAALRAEPAVVLAERLDSENAR